MDRKIHAMHKEYDKNVFHKCGDCVNYIFSNYHDKTYSKCVAYGLSHSKATDWSRNNTACGLFGKDFEKMNYKPLLDVLKRGKKDIGAEIMDGQVSLI